MTQPQSNRLRPFTPMRFGRYTLVARLAQGGMGELFLAQLGGGGQGFQKLCVIKRMLPQLSHDPEFVERFTDEARVLVKLSHGSIAQVLELGTHEDAPFLALEYVDGKDLRRVAARAREVQQPLPLGFTIQVISRVLEALSYAHRKRDDDGRELQLVHRDISPPNILVSYEGEVKVIDFGLARSRLSAARTNPRSLLGKFLYMSPEQARHRAVDRRSDLYAVGLCLYELIAGAHPFETLAPADLMARVAQPNLPHLLTVAPGCPAGLADLVMRALSPDPAARFQSADELRISLLAHLAGADPFAGAESVSRTMHQLFASEYQLERKLLAAARAPLTAQPENRSREETGIISVPALLAARQGTHASPRPPPPPIPAAAPPQVPGAPARIPTPPYGTPQGRPAVPGGRAATTSPPAGPPPRPPIPGREPISREHAPPPLREVAPTFEPTPMRVSPGSPGMLVPSGDGPTRAGPAPQHPREAAPVMVGDGPTRTGPAPQAREPAPPAADPSTGAGPVTPPPRPAPAAAPRVPSGAVPALGAIAIAPVPSAPRSPPPPPPEDDPPHDAAPEVGMDADAALAAWFDAEPGSEGMETETFAPPELAATPAPSTPAPVGAPAAPTRTGSPASASEPPAKSPASSAGPGPTPSASQLADAPPSRELGPTPVPGASREPGPTPVPAGSRDPGPTPVPAAPPPVPSPPAVSAPASAPAPRETQAHAQVAAPQTPPTPASAAPGRTAPPVPLDVAARLARSVKQVSDPDRTPVPQIEAEPPRASPRAQPTASAANRAPAPLDDLFQESPAQRPAAAAYASRLEPDPEATDPSFRLSPPEPVHESLARREGRSRLWTSLAALVVLGVLGGAGFEWWSQQQAAIEAERAAAAEAEAAEERARQAELAAEEQASMEMLAQQDAELAEGVLSVDTLADAKVLLAPLRFERAVRQASTKVDRSGPPGQLGAEWGRTEVLYKRLKAEGRCEAGLLLLCKRYLRVQERVVKARSDDETLRRQVIELRHALEQLGS